MVLIAGVLSNGVDAIIELPSNWDAVPARLPNKTALRSFIYSSDISVTLNSICLSIFLSRVENIMKVGILFFIRISLIVCIADSSDNT